MGVCMFWFYQILGMAHAHSVTASGSNSVVNAGTSKFILSPRALAVLESRSLTAGTLLGLLAIFAVYYARSPWRKLPPKPRGLPIIGNALQLMDKHWLVSKDCKERFGTYQIIHLGDC
jgi:hypothetical protein